MEKANKERRFLDPMDYEHDFHQWSYEQAELVRQRRFAELDLPNLIEEIESMGSEQRFALESCYLVIISHLLRLHYLNWTQQHQHLFNSWRNTIIHERGNAERRERRSPSLALLGQTILEEMYPYARREAAAETGLPLVTFPETCPYSLENVRDREWYPDTVTDLYT